MAVTPPRKNKDREGGHPTSRTRRRPEFLKIASKLWAEARGPGSRGIPAVGTPTSKPRVLFCPTSRAKSSGPFSAMLGPPHSNLVNFGHFSPIFSEQCSPGCGLLWSMFCNFWPALFNFSLFQRCHTRRKRTNSYRLESGAKQHLTKPHTPRKRQAGPLCHGQKAKFTHRGIALAMMPASWPSLPWSLCTKKIKLL